MTRRTCLCLVGCAALEGSGLTASANPAADFDALFDGESLAGWTAIGGKLGGWRAEGGSLVAPLGKSWITGTSSPSNTPGRSTA